MRTIAVVVVAAVVAGSLAAQTTLASEADVVAFEERFLTDFLNRDFETAYDRFRSPATALDASEIDNLEQVTIDQLSKVARQYGDPVDFAIASTRTVGGSLRKDMYLIRYANLPLRAEFVFYNNGLYWVLTYFSWDGDVQQLF